MIRSGRWHATIRILAAGLAALAAAAWGAPLQIAGISASSETGGAKYKIDRAVDGDKKTHWAGDIRKLPIWVRLEFSAPASIDTITILGVSQQSIYDNWRRVHFAFSDGSSFAATFADQWKETTVRFPPRTAKWVKITIESTYKTTNYVGVEEIVASLEGHGVGQPEAQPAPRAVSGKASEAPAPAARPKSDAEGKPAVPSEGAALDRLARDAPGGKARPELWMGDGDVMRAREHILKYAWARQWYEGVLKRADAFAAQSDEEIRSLVPPRGARFDNAASCPVCGGRLGASFSRPHKAWCEKCGMALPNEKYPDDGTGWPNAKTGRTENFRALYNDFAIARFDDALGALADAYALTGEEQFARAASVLFDQIASIYPTTDRGAEWYPGVGGRLRRPFYQAARALIWYCDQYDLLYRSGEWEKASIDAAHGSRRANVEKNFLGNGGEYCRAQMDEYGDYQNFNNGFADYLQGVVAAGRVLGREDFLDYALHSHMSIFNFLENAIDRDGQYFETAFMYSSHTFSLYTHHAEMLRNFRGPKYPDGVRLYDHPKMYLALREAERAVECAGHACPPLGDTGPDLQAIRPGESPPINAYIHDRLEHLAARVSDPTARERIRRTLAAYLGDADKARASAPAELKRWLVYNAADLEDSGKGSADRVQVEGNTLLAAGRGLGILRAGADRAAVLRWGPTLNHGTPDELNVNFFALGREITFDPGYLWAHCRAGWTHATGSHNLVVVNETNQLQDGKGGRGGDLDMWFEAPGFRAMSAEDTMCYSSEKVTRYRRTVCLADGGEPGAYFLDIFRVSGGATHDLNWHFVGEMTPGAGMTLPPAETSGSLAGPEYEWWKKLQPDGWVAGAPRKFYWNAPPGNGYGFIFNLQRVKEPPRHAVFDWKAGERAAEPRWKFAPALCVGGSSGRVHKALPEMNAYFYRGQEAGDWIEYRLAVDEAGEYLIVATFFRYPTYGTVQPYLDGEQLGEAIDSYSPTGYLSDPVVLGRRNLTAGEHRLRLTLTGKNAESSDYYFSIGYLGLDKPDFLERMAEKEAEGVRLHLLPTGNTEIVVGKARSQRGVPDATYAISRRRATPGGTLGSQFVSLVEPMPGHAGIEAFDRLVAEGGGGEPGADDVAAVRIALPGGRVDYVLEAVEPAPERTYRYGQGGETVRFAGRFGVARLNKGRVESLALDGPGVLEAGGETLRVPDSQGLWQGKVAQVDLEARAVEVDASLPEGEALIGQVVQFSNPAWSRRSPFRIQRVERREGRTRIELDAASLVMALGKVGEKAGEPGLLANNVPLDRAGRLSETRFYDGRQVRSESGEDWGRVRHVDTKSWHVRTDGKAVGGANSGFRIEELTAGDSFFVRRVVRREP